MIFVGMLHDAEVERQKQLCGHTYWSSCFLPRIYSFDDFYKMGCQCGSFFEWNKASPLVTWLVKTPLASICSEHFKLPCSRAIQLHQVWLLSQEVCEVVWILRKVERHGLEECEEEEANSFKISWVLKSLYAGVRCGRCGVQPPHLFIQLLQQQ